MVTNFVSLVPHAIRLKNKCGAERLKKLLVVDEFCRGIKLTLAK